MRLSNGVQSRQSKHMAKTKLARVLFGRPLPPLTLLLTNELPPTGAYTVRRRG